MLDFFLIFCLAMLGGAFGSFLNVVIWRLPAGMSLINPPSHCPKCGHSIRFYDNIPILGWIFLGGKCRDCHNPISVRYPFIEALCFSISGLLGWLILCYGWSPEKTSIFYWNGVVQWKQAIESGVLQNLNEKTLLYSYDTLVQNGCLLTVIWSTLFFLLLTMGIIEYDGKKVPNAILLFASAFTVGAFFIGGLFFLPIRNVQLPPPFQEDPVMKLSFFTGLFLLMILTRKEVYKILVLTLLLIPFLGTLRPFVVIYTLTIMLLLAERYLKKPLTPALAFFGAVPFYLIFHEWFAQL